LIIAIRALTSSGTFGDISYGIALQGCDIRMNADESV
jgi:hypothetical protein